MSAPDSTATIAGTSDCKQERQGNMQELHSTVSLCSSESVTMRDLQVGEYVGEVGAVDNSQSLQAVSLNSKTHNISVKRVRWGKSASTSAT